jgi:hypothetical protein
MDNMSDNNENKVADEGQPSPVQPPTPAPAPASQPPFGYSAQPQQVACPVCATVVAIGTSFCPQCGSPIPSAVPPAWPGIQPAPAHKRNVALIVGIVLIAIIVIGIGGYAFYQNQQQLVLQAAKNSERDAANQAASQLQAKCFSSSVDYSHLSNMTGTPSGYMTISETFGVFNPTKFVMDATWTFTLDFLGPAWILTASSPFHIPTNGTGYAELPFKVTAAQLINLQSADLSKYTATLDGTYIAIGTYGTYNLTQHSTYDSASNTGTGTLGASGSLPKC